MNSELGCQNWIKSKGKEKIQSFQDSFAEMFNLSLCLLSLEGRTLTVWSNSSLFCHYMMKKNYERCMQERQKIIQCVIDNKESCIFTCYMGLTAFACPVFYNKNVIAVCFGGAIYLEENYKKTYTNNSIAQHIPVISTRELKDITKMLENIFVLCNSEESAAMREVKTKIIDNKQELVFLTRKVSQRELDIVRLINKGLSNKEIARQLDISEKTVKTHVSSILRKLKMKDRMQIVIFCKQNNIV